MKTKAFDLIETIRNAIAPKYEFPYYALIRIHTRHYGTIHIPAPMFDGGECNPRSQWAGDLPIAQDKRTGRYFECPFCGEKSYYSGVCQNCRRDFEVWDDEEEDWVDGELPLEYRNREALKASVKKEILYRIDHRIPNLGIISAEIVLSDPASNVCGEYHTPFMKHSSWNAQNALDRVEKIIQSYENLKKHEAYQEMIRNYEPEDGVPLDYIEGDVIEVEGSEELRRHVNGIWQHKHPDSGYDYWHPMARIHKRSNMYPMCMPEE
ncbi:MAG: hypothetical protein PHS36_08955 [Candidatus Cloacimonetes bacterium]|nr:hypothetical protein [Candidatus Cloacimonadota bacterium]